MATETERREAVAKMMDWAQQDDTVKTMIRTVCMHLGQPAIGHVARFHPEVFDELFEESEAMMSNDT